MKLLAAKFILLLLLSAMGAVAQPVFYKTYTIPAENISVQINLLYQLKNNYILVGANTGIYRFDGITFQKIGKEKNVPDNVTAICEASDGKVWVGFGDGKIGFLQNNNTVQLQNPEEGFPVRSIKKIIQDAAGTIWIATAGEGLYYYSGNHYYNINTDDGLSDNYVYDIITSPKGIIAATDRGINFCNIISGNKNITSVTSANSSIPDNIVRCLFNQNDKLFLGMQDAGIGILNVENIKSASFTKQWNFGTVNSLINTGNDIWIATESGGLLHASSAINSLQASHFQQVIPGKITCLLKGAENNLWAAVNNQVIRTNGNKLQSIATLSATDAANMHTLLAENETNIWFNINQQLKHIIKDEQGNWKEEVYNLPVPINSQISSLYKDKFEHIWIGTMGNGTFLLDAKTRKFRKITENKLLSGASVLSITGKDNLVWIASLEGAVKCVLQDGNSNIDQPLILEEFIAISKISTNYIYHIFIDSRNRTWFATDGKGLAMYENGKMTIYNHTQGLKSEVVYQVEEDNSGNIWLTTFNAGLVKFDGNNFQYFTTGHGLSDINISSLTSDTYGNLYLTHKNGVDILNTKTSSFSYINADQGIIKPNTDLNILTKDKAGNIYFVADNTIFRYTPSAIINQPKIIIDKVQLFLKDIPIPGDYTFSSDQDNISFYYSGLYYSQPEKVQYQYKLEGFDDDWISTNDRRKDFPQLPAGTYTFKVRASLNRNFDNAMEASFTFTIQKPLWARWWFIVVAGLTLIGALYWIVRSREKRLQKLERLEKEKIQSQFETLRNQVNPHFLFNSFNTLVSEIEDDPKRAVQYVEHMADFFRSIVTYREKDVISLAEEINIIKDYLFIQRKRYGNAFQVNINISPEEQRQYFLAPLTLQLLAENAIKHNTVLKEKVLLLEIFIEAEQLVVRNNINPKFHHEKSAGLGLQNIQKRYSLLTNKTVVIRKDEDYFTVTIPLIKTTDAKDTYYRR